MKLNGVFSDGMVLQHGKPIRVFGEAVGAVTVSFCGECKSVEAGGKWLLEFAPRECGGPYELTASCGGESVTLRDIMIGEVFLFSGQSNMEFTMKEEVTPEEQYVSDPLLRLYIGGLCRDEQFVHPADGWIKAGLDNINRWSALAYLTGLRIREKYGCAVGMIVCAQGATGIQAWMREACFEGEIKPMAEHKCEEKWQWFNVTSGLYHFMIEPVMPYSLAGIVWYQGESNANSAESVYYAGMLDSMIADWRAGFDDKSLPFCAVVIADNTRFGSNASWALIQKTQESVGERVPHAFSVVSADLCETDNIHPPTKYKLAQRIFEALIKNNVIGGKQ